MSRTVLAAVDDMFFAAKIRAAAEALSVELRFARSADALLAAARQHRAELVIVDLQSERINPFQLATQLKADDSLRGISVWGFYSHVLAELPAKAREAGFDQVMPRSAFSQRLAEILSGSEGEPRA